MIEAVMNADEGTAKLKINADIPELFAECCMFISSIANRLSTTAEPLKIIFTKALAEYCNDLAEGKVDEGISNVVAFDHAALDKLKEIADKQKEE
jgi:hypothetical protein